MAKSKTPRDSRNRLGHSGTHGSWVFIHILLIFETVSKSPESYLRRQEASSSKLVMKMFTSSGQCLMRYLVQTISSALSQSVRQEVQRAISYQPQRISSSGMARTERSR